jgi:hypothetical protein
MAMLLEFQPSECQWNNCNGKDHAAATVGGEGQGSACLPAAAAAVKTIVGF